MSHWTEIKTQIKNLNAARAACREIGVELICAAPGQKVQARGYAGNTIAADAVIKLKGPYDVALTREANGSYAMKCDWYHGHIAAELGQNAQKFTQLYGVHAATMAAPRGAMVRRTIGANGSILLTMTTP